jgi:thiol-disulfide isomerase/thioredoxin
LLRVKHLALLISLLLAASAQAQVSTIVHPAPDFPSGGHWLDGGARVPHHIRRYRGKVLLIDFWEYTCINCIRDFTVLKHWYAKYHSYGLEVLGVHYAEFAMGFSDINVRCAGGSSLHSWRNQHAANVSWRVPSEVGFVLRTP